MPPAGVHPAGWGDNQPTERGGGKAAVEVKQEPGLGLQPACNGLQPACNGQEGSPRGVTCRGGTPRLRRRTAGTNTDLHNLPRFVRSVSMTGFCGSIINLILSHRQICLGYARL